MKRKEIPFRLTVVISAHHHDLGVADPDHAVLGYAVRQRDHVQGEAGQEKVNSKLIYLRTVVLLVEVKFVIFWIPILN